MKFLCGGTVPEEDLTLYYFSLYLFALGVVLYLDKNRKYYKYF
jgi:hypothetical protein